MTTADAARLLGVSVRQVRNLVDSGELAETGRVGSSLILDAAAGPRAGRGPARPSGQ
jgi:excisionase family DNA binding protein